MCDDVCQRVTQARRFNRLTRDNVCQCVPMCDTRAASSAADACRRDPTLLTTRGLPLACSSLCSAGGLNGVPRPGVELGPEQPR
eukprot:600866-Prorocentrum_minimum.AAC.4